MSDNGNKKHRITSTVPMDMYERLKYWSDKRDCSMNEYLYDALEEKIGRENGDYDLPTAEVARLNQLIDIVTVLSTNVKSLEEVTISGFDSLLNLTKGDNYLLENEDGDF